MINGPILLSHGSYQEDKDNNASADDLEVGDIQDQNRPQSSGVVASSRVSPPILLVQHYG